MMAADNMRSVLSMIRALADRPRLRIVMLLRGGELCACQIVEVLGLAASTVSKHLSILDAAGLVESRKSGRWMHYRLPSAPDGCAGELLAWATAALGADAAVGRDADTLKRVVRCEPSRLCRQQRERVGRGRPRAAAEENDRHANE